MLLQYNIFKTVDTLFFKNMFVIHIVFHTMKSNSVFVLLFFILAFSTQRYNLQFAVSKIPHLTRDELTLWKSWNLQLLL